MRWQNTGRVLPTPRAPTLNHKIWFIFSEAQLNSDKDKPDIADEYKQPVKKRMLSTDARQKVRQSASTIECSKQSDSTSNQVSNNAQNLLSNESDNSSTNEESESLLTANSSQYDADAESENDNDDDQDDDDSNDSLQNGANIRSESQIAQEEINDADDEYSQFEDSSEPLQLMNTSRRSNISDIYTANEKRGDVLEVKSQTEFVKSPQSQFVRATPILSSPYEDISDDDSEIPDESDNSESDTGSEGECSTKKNSTAYRANTQCQRFSPCNGGQPIGNDILYQAMQMSNVLSLDDVIRAGATITKL